jgi:hypothetical protein
VARGFLLLFLCALLRAETLEDAARALAKSVAARLAPNQTAHVTTRNVSSLGRADVTRAQSNFEQAVRRRVRNPVTIEITLTISENLKGYLLIADFKPGAERIVEMEPYRPEPAGASARPALTIGKRMLWEQAPPILDIAVFDEQMLMLDTIGVTRYDRHDGKWTAAESASLPSAVRGPRGRIEVADESLTVELPGATCHGTWKPALELHCESGAVFTAGRNTLEAAIPFFSDAQIGGVHLVAEPDGRTHIYDATQTASGTIDDWGSDIATLATCAGPRVAVTGAGESGDTVTVYDLVHAVPIRVSDSVDFPGPVTALWPSKSGAFAVVRNLATGRYEAYGLTVDCGR